MSLLDFIGSMLTIVFILLLIRRQRIGWIFGGIGSAIYAVLFFQASLYFQSVLFSYYVIMAVYGFGFWTKNVDVMGCVVIHRWRSIRTNIAVFIALVLLGFTLSTILSQYTQTTMGLADATITTVAFFATYLQAKSKVENWYYWVFVNIVSASVSLLAGLYFFFLLSLFLLVMSFYGIFKWQKIMLTQKEK